MRARATVPPVAAIAAATVSTMAPRECAARHAQIPNAPAAMGTTTSQGPKIDKTVEPTGDISGRPQTWAPMRTSRQIASATPATISPPARAILMGLADILIKGRFSHAPVFVRTLAAPPHATLV